MSALATAANGTGNFLGCIIGSLLATLQQSRYCLRRVNTTTVQNSCNVDHAWIQTEHYKNTEDPNYNPFFDTANYKGDLRKVCWMGCVDGSPSKTIYLQNNNIAWEHAYTLAWILCIFVFILQMISIWCFTNPNLKHYQLLVEENKNDGSEDSLGSSSEDEGNARTSNTGEAAINR